MCDSFYTLYHLPNSRGVTLVGDILYVPHKLNTVVGRFVSNVATVKFMIFAIFDP